MREIALHIMDIVENGIAAGADTVQILIDEARGNNLLKIELRDNGKGIPPEMLDRVTDPFVTERKTRRVGLGLSLLKAAAIRCDGTFSISSEVGKGTCTIAMFRYDHIDRAPLGDMAGTLPLIVIGNPDVVFIYEHIIDGNSFKMDTREIKAGSGCGTSFDPVYYTHVSQLIRKGLERIDNRSRKGATYV